jgi:glutamyl-tRNA reductase
VVTVDLLKRVRRARRGRSLFLIDIAVPRDVEPDVHRLENVFLYNVDDLSAIVAESLSGRAAEASKAEAIVEQEAKSFDRWTHERGMSPTIVSLRARTRSVLAAEVERSLSGKLKHLGPADREALAVMIEAATNKLLHAPVTRLKTVAGDPRAAELVDAVRELFDLPDAPAEPEDDGAEEAARPEPPADRPAPRPPASGTSEGPALAMRSVPDREL